MGQGKRVNIACHLEIRSPNKDQSTILKGEVSICLPTFHRKDPDSRFQVEQLLMTKEEFSALVTEAFKFLGEIMRQQRP